MLMALLHIGEPEEKDEDQQRTGNNDNVFMLIQYSFAISSIGNSSSLPACLLAFLVYNHWSALFSCPGCCCCCVCGFSHCKCIPIISTPNLQPPMLSSLADTALSVGLSRPKPQILIIPECRYFNTLQDYDRE